MVLSTTSFVVVAMAVVVFAQQADDGIAILVVANTMSLFTPPVVALSPPLLSTASWVSVIMAVVVIALQVADDVASHNVFDSPCH